MEKRRPFIEEKLAAIPDSPSWQNAMKHMHYTIIELLEITESLENRVDELEADSE
jgi:hypothetical protein